MVLFSFYFHIFLLLLSKSYLLSSSHSLSETNSQSSRLWTDDKSSKQPTDHSFSFPRLVVFCLLLLLSCFFGCLFLFYFIVETRRKKINKTGIKRIRKEKINPIGNRNNAPAVNLRASEFLFCITNEISELARGGGRMLLET